MPISAAMMTTVSDITVVLLHPLFESVLNSLKMVAPPVGAMRNRMVEQSITVSEKLPMRSMFVVLSRPGVSMWFRTLMVGAFRLVVVTLSLVGIRVSVEENVSAETVSLPVVSMVTRTVDAFMSLMGGWPNVRTQLRFR